MQYNLQIEETGKMEDIIKNTQLKLLKKYIESKTYVISETSKNMREDYTKLQFEIMEYCIILGIEYTDSLFHESVIDCINNYEF